MSASDILRDWLLAPVLATIDAGFSATRSAINGRTDTLERIITMNQAELEAALEAAADKTDKIIAEVQASTAALQQAIADAGNTTPAIDAALKRLQDSLQSADDLNPDAQPPLV